MVNSIEVNSEFKNSINNEIKEIVAKLLQVDVNSLEEDTPFLEMGADSLILMEAINKIQDRFHVKIPIRDLFSELGTLNALIDYIIKHRENNLLASVEQSTPEQIPQSFVPIQISESENNHVSDFGVEQLIKQQLNIISQQLALLQGNGHIPNQQSAPLQSNGYIPNQQPVETGVKPAPKPEPIESSTAPVGAHNAWFKRDLSKKKQSQKKDEHLGKLIADYNQKTPTSKQLTQDYRAVLADNRASAGFRLSTKEMLYPIIGTRSEGAYIWDKDDNKYIDFTMGFGTNLFGHTPSFIQQVLHSQIEKGFQIGPQTEMAGEVAQLVTELTGQERVAFCNSGSEAIMTAVRLARSVTAKNKIVIFNGSYHGVFDGVLARRSGANKRGVSVPIAGGTPESFVIDVLVLDYGDEESLQIIEENLTELAAVIVEPVQSRHPELQPQAFLKQLRKITESSGVALIFDEVITGFRINSGGAQQHFGVQADLATYGKIVGGGLPIGLVAGNRRFLDSIDGGMWQYGDDSYPSAESIFFAGTFSKHPLTMAASKAVLQKIKAEKAEIYPQLERKAHWLTSQLNQFFVEEQIPIEIVSFGSLFRFKYSGNYDILFYHLMVRGIFIWEGRNCFVSTAHSDADIQTFIEAVKASLQSMKAAGYFGEVSTQTVASLDWYPLSDSQQRFVSLAEFGDGGKQAGNIGCAIKFDGVIDNQVLSQAWQALLERHVCLNNIIDIDGEKQKLNSTKISSFTEIDLSQPQSPNLEDFLAELARKDFDLANGPLAQAVFIKTNQSQSYLCIVCHHTISDGWSFAIITEELFKLYEAYQNHQKPQLTPTLNYRSYVTQEHENLSPSALNFWVEKYVNNPPEKLFDVVNPNCEIFAGQRLRRMVEVNSTHKKFKQLGKNFKSTPFILLFSLFQSCLHQKFKQERFTVAIPIAKRQFEGGDSLLGCCVNLLPIICGNKSWSNSIEELVKNTKDYFIEAIAKQDFSYNQWLKIIAEKLNQPKFQPIQVSFNLEPQINLPNFNGQRIELLPLPVSYVEFPLMLNILELDNQLQIELDYQMRYFNQSKAENLLEDFAVMIEELLN